MKSTTRTLVGNTVQLMIVADDYELPTLGAPANPETLLELVHTSGNSVATMGYYWWNGTKWSLLSNQPVAPDGTFLTQPSLYQRIKNKRPKLMSIGNSINTLNMLTQAADSLGYGSWRGWGYIQWIHMLTGAAFDRCRSIPTVFSNSGQVEQIDELGCYGWPGATLIGTVPNMLQRFTQIFNQLIDAPDIIYLSALFENDIGQTATPSGPQIVAGGIQALNLCRQTFPDALIILATPGPSTSYTVAAQHTAWNYVTAWCQGINSTFDNVLCETNTAYSQPGTDQPIAIYMQGGSGPHPNELGACLRGKSFLTQFGYLFSNPLPIPTTDSGYGAYQYNPNFTKTGGVGSVPPGNATIYTGLDFYTDTNIGANLTSLAGGGVGIVITSTGPVTTHTGTGPTSDAITTAVVANNIYVGVSQLTVVNPANIFNIEVVVNYSGGAATAYRGLYFDAATTAQNPQGLSGVLQAGDKLIIMTPPILPPVNTTTIANMQTKINTTTGIPVGAAGANNPSVNIFVQNAIQIPNTLPTAITNTAGKPAQAITVGASPFTYTAASAGDVVMSGGTVSAVSLVRGATTVAAGALGGIFPVRAGDKLMVTYTVAPVMTMFPN